ncbi:MAG: YqjD family protein [Rhodomicrobium sp.]
MPKDPMQEMNSAPDSGKSEIEELRRLVKELSGKYESMSQHALSDVKETVRQNMGDIEKQIREKPVQATLIAAGVGFLLGALLSR